MSLRVTWADIEGLRRFDNALKSLGEDTMRKVANRALNRTGDMARTQVRRALAKQTGLPRKVIVKALKVKRSEWGTLSYTMTTGGGDIALKYFKARETRRGVSAAPFGKRQVFAHTFIRGGRFPNRKSLNMGGQVFMPDLGVSDWGRPIEKQKSGVVIPVEMVQGATKDAFETTVAKVLPRRVAHEISRATNGAVG